VEKTGENWGKIGKAVSDIQRTRS